LLRKVAEQALRATLSRLALKEHYRFATQSQLTPCLEPKSPGS
jgi:hypothetical protein